MELGIGPSLSAGWIMHLAYGLKVFKCDFSVFEDRRSYFDAEKCKSFNLVLSIIMTLGESVAMIYSGYYGEFEYLTWHQIIFLFL